MSSSQVSAPSSLRIASVAVLVALTFVIGFFVRLPLPATQGVFTLADLAIFFAGFTFGPLSAATAGGVGAALIDLIGGTAPYAPVSFIVHGLEGLLAGLIASVRRSPSKPSLLLWVLGGVVGVAVVVGGYFAGEILFFGGPAAAVTELIPNVAQGVIGAVGGALLTLAVRRAYPPVSGLWW